MKKLLGLFTAISLLALMPACTQTSVPGDKDDNQKDSTDVGNKPLTGELTLLVDEPVIRADGKSEASFTVLVGRLRLLKA